MADIGITKFRVQIPRDGASPSTPGFAQSEGQDPVNPPGSPTGIYVPYLGATGAVNLGEFGLTTGNVIFDTTPTNIPTAQGAMYWDADDETVALIMNGAIQKVGEDAFYQVKNQTGSNIAKGVAVRFAGTVGNSGRLLIEPFLADGTYPSTYFMGVTMEAIPNGEDGKVMWFGRIRGINTNAYNESDILYASTTVAGGFQTTVPQAPNNIVEVCAVVTKSATVGTIFVRPTLGSNINRDEGVKITSGATGDLLQLQAGGLWENKTVASVIGTLASKWTDVGTGNIYRNSRVRIGGTADPVFTLDITGNSRVSAVSSNSLTNSFQSLLTAGYTGSARTDAVIATNSTAGTGQNLNTPALNAGGSFASIATTTGYNVGMRGVAFGSSSNNIGFYGDSSTSATGNNIGLYARSGNSSSKNVSAYLTSSLGATIPTISKDTVLLLDSAVVGLPYLVLQNTGSSGFEITDSFNLSFPSTNGTKIGTATSQKLAFWNATPIVQPTTGVAESAFVENAGGTAVNDDSTFDGYTLRQVVKALRNAGLLA